MTEQPVAIVPFGEWEQSPRLRWRPEFDRNYNLILKRSALADDPLFRAVHL